MKKSSKSYLKNLKLSGEEIDVFISYAAEEKKLLAKPMEKKLKKVCPEYRVWIDDSYLDYGDKLRNSIESIIKKCKIAIVFFSENYVRKGWTRYELDRLLEEYTERNLIVILVDMTNGTNEFESYVKLKQNIDNQYIYKKDAVDQELIAARIQELLKIDL